MVALLDGHTGQPGIGMITNNKMVPVPKPWRLVATNWERDQSPFHAHQLVATNLHSLVGAVVVL